MHRFEVPKPKLGVLKPRLGAPVLGVGDPKPENGDPKPGLADITRPRAWRKPSPPALSAGPTGPNAPLPRAHLPPAAGRALSPEG